MSFAKLQAWEKARAKEREQAEAERIETEKRRELKRAVKDVIPKAMRTLPKRGRGRTAVGGLSKKEIATLRSAAHDFMDGEAGFLRFKRQVQHTAITMLLIDGIFGTEPWRAQGPNGGVIAAHARVRYLDNAVRILEDMLRGLGKGGAEAPKLLEGVLDAEVVIPPAEPAEGAKQE